MPVGTGTIGVLEVIAEVVGASASLGSCISNYSIPSMHPTYWSSKPSAPASLLEFRGYDATPSLGSFTLNTSPEVSVANACANSGGSTHYHNGSGSSPVTSDTVYTNSSGTTVFNGGTQWFKSTTGNTALLINTVGFVLAATSC